MNEKQSWELDICWDCLVFIMFIFFMLDLQWVSAHEDVFIISSKLA